MSEYKKQRAAQYYVQQEVKGMIDHDIDTGDMERAFISGAEWSEKDKAKTKVMCLRDKTKVSGKAFRCISAAPSPPSML